MKIKVYTTVYYMVLSGKDLDLVLFSNKDCININYI